MLGWLVQDHQTRTLAGHQQPRQRHPLRLTARQGRALLADLPLRVQLQSGLVHRLEHLIIGGVLVADPHVLGQRGREDVRILRQVADATRYAQLPGPRGNQPHDGGRERRLAQSRRADQGHRLPGPDRQVDAGE